jgi:hypothetical protein
MGTPKEPLWKRFKSKGEELYDAMKSSTASPRAKYVDHERLDLKRDFRMIIEHGTVEDLVQALSAFGKGPETAEGKELLAEFKRMRDGD